MKTLNRIIVIAVLLMGLATCSLGQSNVPKLESTGTPTNESNNNSEAEIFTIVEQMPSFPGGEQKLLEYVAKNTKYPQIAQDNGIQGRVFVSFVVETDGSISNVKVTRSLGGGCDEEAVRVIESMPKWEPGKQRGQVVRVSYQIPVNFKLQ